MKKIIIWTLVLVWLFGTTFAFFWSKSCEELNSKQCFKDIEKAKDEYKKYDKKATLLSWYIDSLELQKSELQGKIDQATSDKAWVELQMAEISSGANAKRIILQQMGF